MLFSRNLRSFSVVSSDHLQRANTLGGKVIAALTTNKRTNDIIDHNLLNEHTSRPFRIAVVGCGKVGKSSLVNSLLGKNVLKTDLKSKSPRIQRISYSDNLQEVISTDGLVLEVGVPHDILREKNIEIIDTPAYGTVRIDPIVAERSAKLSDFVIFVTDCHRQLSNQEEVKLFEKLRTKNPVVVISRTDLIDPKEDNLPTLVADVKDTIQRIHQKPFEPECLDQKWISLEREQEEKLRPKIRLFPYSAPNAAASVGLLHLKNYLFKDMEHQQRELYKAKTIVLNCQQELFELSEPLRKRAELINRCSEKLKAIKIHMQSFEKKVLKDFSSQHVTILDQKTRNFQKSTEEFFAKYGTYKLIFKSEEISQDLFNHVFLDNATGDPQQNIAYVIGQLNEQLQKEIRERIVIELKELVQDLRATEYPPLSDIMSQDYEVLISNINAITFSTPPLDNKNATGTNGPKLAELVNLNHLPIQPEHLNKFITSKVKDFGDVNRSISIRKKVERGFFQALGFQGVALGLAAFTNHLVSITEGVSDFYLFGGYGLAAGFSLLGFGWLKIIWNGQKKKLMKDFQKLNQELKGILVSILETEMKHNVFIPLNNALRVMTDVTETNRQRLQEAESQALSIEEEIYQLKAQVSAQINVLDKQIIE